MSLLKEIQDTAVKSDSDLGETLRMCKVLAARLGSKPLEDWLIWESNGYPNDENLPDYRKWPVVWRGYFRGMFGQAMENAPIPLLSFPEDIRELFTIYRCRDSIAALEQALAQAQSRTVGITNNDLPLLLGCEVYDGFNCLQVSGRFDIGNYVEVINSVRNRILDFALALGKVEPDAGEKAQESSGPGPTAVTQIFNMTVYGGEAHLTATDSRQQPEGDLNMRDSYKVGQAGAVGPGARAHDNTFQQIWNEHADVLDLGKLKGELAELHEALREKATEPDHQIAIGNVAAAEKAAEAGNGPRVLEYLRNAGAWTLGIAKEIATKVAAEAIAASMK